MTSKKQVGIVLGTHTIGDKVNSDGICHYDSKEEVLTLLDAFYNRGYRDLDTAAMYPGSEARLGEVAAPSRFVIHTKVMSLPGDHEAAKIAASIDHSLSDLRVSSVETMFLHVPDRTIPFQETAKAMDVAFKQGKFKKFGLSNYTAAEVQQIIDICEQNGYNKPKVYQGQYNALARRGEKELFPILRKYDMAFFAFSPGAAGFFSETASTTGRWSNTNIIGQIYLSQYDKPSLRAVITNVHEATKKHGISGHEAALRWTAFHSILDGSRGDAVIFGSSKMVQFNKSLDALEAGELPKDVVDAFNALFEVVGDDAPPYHM